MLKKIRKEFPRETCEGLWLDEAGCCAFAEKKKDFQKFNSSWKFTNPLVLTVEEIEQEIEKAEKLENYCFVLKNNVGFVTSYYEETLKLVSSEKIKKITSCDDSPLVIETVFGYFLIAPAILRDNESYSSVQNKIQEMESS